jgi:hypothetical protein
MLGVALVTTAGFSWRFVLGCREGTGFVVVNVFGNVG